MTISIMLPLVRLWVPRDAYGRVWGLLQSGVQTGGLLAYAWYGHRLAQGNLPWRAPFALAATLCALTALLCARLLRDERPAPLPRPPAKGRAAAAAVPTSAAGSGRLLPAGLLRRFAAKPQFWLMLLAVGTYTPIYEYGTFVSNYLKQLEIARDGNGGGAGGGAAAALHCIENQACAPRVALYQLSYIVSLLLGSMVYDRCSQRDSTSYVPLLPSGTCGHPTAPEPCALAQGSPLGLKAEGQGPRRVEDDDAEAGQRRRPGARPRSPIPPPLSLQARQGPDGLFAHERKRRLLGGPLPLGATSLRAAAATRPDRRAVGAAGQRPVIGGGGHHRQWRAVGTPQPAGCFGTAAAAVAPRRWDQDGARCGGYTP